MSSITLFLTSIGLSMDACAVSVTNGMCCDNYHKKQILLTALAFGFFQAFMPVIGYAVGHSFSDLITFLDHWLALILLGFIGGKMVLESIKELKYPELCLVSEKNLTFKKLIAQAVATSIDALAVGIGLAVMKVNILESALYIGVITFFSSIAGSILGKKCGHLCKARAELIGGLILVFIGVKIFIEHTI